MYTIIHEYTDRLHYLIPGELNGYDLNYVHPICFTTLAQCDLQHGIYGFKSRTII